MKVILLCIFLSVLEIINPVDNTSDYSPSIRQEAEFLELLDEYETNLEKDLSKEHTCWIEKPTSNINLYFGIKADRQIQLNFGYMLNIYRFDSGNTYALMVKYDRIIHVWRFGGSESFSVNSSLP